MWLIMLFGLALFSCRINAQETRIPPLLIIRAGNNEKIKTYMLIKKNFSQKSMSSEKIPENNQQSPQGTRK